MNGPVPIARPDSVVGMRSLWIDLLERVLPWPGYVLFFVMLVLPTTYQPVKGVLLAVTLTTIALRVLATGRISLHPLIATMTCGFAALGLFFTARGAIAGEPGAIRMSTVYVLWPLAYTILVAGVADLAALRRLFRLLVWATLVISIDSLHYVLWELGWWPDALYLRFERGQLFGYYGGYIEFNLYSMSSLLFLVPFVSAAALFLPRNSQVPVARLTVWCALALGLVSALLSGRRGLLVVLPLGPIVGFLLWMNLPGAVRRPTRRAFWRSALATAALVIGVIVYLDMAHGLTLRALTAMLATGFDFAWDPIARTRADQYAALINGWLQSPWLGSGHGAPAPGVIRSFEMPWAYELSYLALLYHTGLLGFAAYAAGVAWVFVMGARIIRSGVPGTVLLLPILAGTSAFLVANATNPYLEKYDHLWVVFLPIAYINYWLLNAPKAGSSGPGQVV